MPSVLTNAIVTAYCACAVCCGHSGRLTASGSIPRAARTIAAPSWIPFGSVVKINNTSYVVEDRMSRRYPTRFDIFMSSHREAQLWGKKVLNVEVAR